ncbi:nicotinamide-nucleotide amidase [Gammaproteobacteria bacterium]
MISKMIDALNPLNQGMGENAMVSQEPRVATRVACLAQRLTERGWRLVTAESCTGGWIAKVLTDLPGSSAWFELGLITYSHQAKIECLGVRPETLQQFGAVSAETVREMALGALARGRAQVAIAVSGIAGPGGGSPDQPAGTVWLAWAIHSGDVPPSVVTERSHFPGCRDEVRYQAVIHALDGLLRRLP